jgi:hypothetical protein
MRITVHPLLQNALLRSDTATGCAVCLGGQPRVTFCWVSMGYPLSRWLRMVDSFLSGVRVQIGRRLLRAERCALVDHPSWKEVVRVKRTVDRAVSLVILVEPQHVS